MTERMYQAVIGVLVLIILIGGGYMLATKRSGSPSAAVSAESAASSSTQSASSGSQATSGSYSGAAGASGTAASMMTTAAAGDAVSAADQQAGGTVSIQSVTLAKEGWVAVRDSGNWVLGAERVSAGTHGTVEVTLLRDTVAGQSYDAVLYVDNGNGTFDVHGDSLVVGADGNPISAAFLAK